MKTLSFFAVVLMLCTFGVAQSKPAEHTNVPPPLTGDAVTAPSTAKIPVTLESKDALRAAIHKQDQAQKQLSDLNAQLMQIQNQATAKMQTLQAQEKQADEAVTQAKTKAYAAAKLDPGKYDLDLETMEFSPKTASEAKK